MRKITKRTTAIVAAAVIGVGALGATAWANGWFQSSTTASVKTAAAGPITGTVTFKEAIYPTGAADIDLTFTNPNPYKVKVTGIALSGAIGGATSGCTADNAGITFDTPADFIIDNNASKTKTVAVNKGAHMNAFASNACEHLTDAAATVVLTGSVVS